MDKKTIISFIMLAVLCLLCLVIAATLPSFYKFISIIVMILGGKFIVNYNQENKI